MSTPGAFNNNCLPPELLDIVFDITLHCRHWIHFNHLRATCKDVCRNWRRRIIGSPRYWARIAIFRYTKHEFLQATLPYAGNNLLQLHVDGTEYFTLEIEMIPATLQVSCIDTSSFAGMVSSLLRPYFPRVQSLAITAKKFEDWETLARALASLPNDSLCNFDVDVKYGSFSPMQTFGANGWNVVNQVRSTRLFPIVGDAPFYQHLKHLSLYNVPNLPLPRFLDVLRSAAHLRHLDLDQVNFTEEAHDIPSVTLAELIHLRFQCSMYMERCMLQNLSLPALVTLDLDIVGTELFEDVIQSCSPFLHQIREVQLTVIDADAASLLFFWLHLGAIQSVNLKFSPLTVWESLSTLASSRPHVWPNLEAISLPRRNSVTQEEKERVIMLLRNL